MAVFGGVATFAKRLAIRRFVFPRQPSANVLFVMNLKHYIVERSGTKASDTAAPMQLDYVLPKLNPIGVAIVIHKMFRRLL